jgi:hypothetical protein
MTPRQQWISSVVSASNSSRPGGSGKVDVQHLKLNPPVRIKRKLSRQPMELVAGRIVSGHLIEFHGP